MRGLYTLKANTEDYLGELKLLAHHLQEEHGQALRELKSPILITVELPNGQLEHFLISQEGISHTSKPPQVEDRIVLNYRDLIRVIEKPSRLLRYILEGRVKIYGNYKRVLSAIEKVF